MSDKFYEKLEQFVVLAKAKEDLSVHPDSRREYRKQRNIHEGVDALHGQLTPAKGVSDVGIEARRGDSNVPKEQVISHGYGRATDPDKHKKLAQDIHRSLLHSLQQQPKADLPKSEGQSETLKKPYASEAQRGFFHSPGAKEAGITSADVKHWDKASKGKELPAHKSELQKDLDLRLDSPRTSITRRKRRESGSSLNLPIGSSFSSTTISSGGAPAVGGSSGGSFAMSSNKAKLPVGPDVVSGPQLDNDVKFINSRAQVSGPTMLNVRDVRDKVKEALDKTYGQKKLNKSINPSEQHYHIHDISGGQNVRITAKPMKLGDIHSRYGKNIEQKGFRLIPHQPAAVQASPQQPQKK